MNADFNKHGEFINKISANTYNCLEQLFTVCNGLEISHPNVELLKTIKTIDIDCLLKDKMKASIYYIRLCKVIEDLLKEYEGYDNGFRKTIIEYYIQSNVMKEMNTIGLSWYYDVKFKKDTSTLYSVGYGKKSNWHELMTERHKSTNEMKELKVQEIFKGCREHINKGGEMRLKSLSKCLGVDLFKYMQLDENGIANLYIIKDAPLNFVEQSGNRASLQEYLMKRSDEQFDKVGPLNFCLDFSHPRNDEAANYNKWSENFLENAFVSQSEFEDKKKAFDSGDDIYDYLILNLLRAEHMMGSDKALSSRVSPVADKEVIASSEFWKIEEYTEATGLMAVQEKCYHIAFSESEYYQLIFSYFESYYNKKNTTNKRTSFREIYDILLTSEKEEIERIIHSHEKKNEKLAGEQLPNEAIKNREAEIAENERKIRLYRSYRASLNNIITDETNAKVQFALSFLDWDKEKLSKSWSLENIYPAKNNKNKNLNINAYKYLCKRAAFA